LWGLWYWDDLQSVLQDPQGSVQRDAGDLQELPEFWDMWAWVYEQDL